MVTRVRPPHTNGQYRPLESEGIGRARLGLTRTVRSKTTDTNPFWKHSEWSWSTELAPVTTVKSLYWSGGVGSADGGQNHDSQQGKKRNE